VARAPSARWLGLAKLAVGLALLAVLFSRVDLAGVRERLAGIHLGWLALMVLLPHLAILLSTEKWRVLLRVLGHPVPLARLYVLYLIGTFANNFLPSMVGGDALRVLWLRREQREGSAVLAATFMERHVGLAGLVSLLPLAALHPQIAGAYPVVRWLVLAVGAGYVAGTWLLFSRPGAGRSFTGVRLAPLRKALSALARAHEHVRSFRRAGAALAWGYVLSLLFYLLAPATVWVAGRAVGAAIDPYFLVSVMPLVLLVGLLPISVNGLGLLEASYVVFLGLAGVPQEASLAIALLLRLRIVLTAAIGGLSLMAYRPAASGAEAGV
jgi:uncharacterized protein (TIRG00374 family)